ncbi:hypothetical protein F5B20DRAFT_579289 [Whalleya microplaca]|nr:hypothetical protein F5B20DRAFT_579289 [Whalleya microplaca]
MMQRTVAVAVLTYLQLTAVDAQGSKGRPIRYVCPQDNGLQYTTPAPNAVTFELKCDQGTTAKRIDNTQKNSQKECADFCSEHPECQSADYDWITKNCARFSEYIPTIPMANVNTWFPLQERTQQDPKPAPQQRSAPNCPATPNLIVESVSNSSSFTSDSKCPQDDNKIFVSAGGQYMRTRCNAHVNSQAPFASSALSTLTECFNYCSDTPGCNSVSWEGGRPSWLCRLYSEGEEAAGPCANHLHDMAFIMDPPTIEAADDPLILCSTECPYANGQTWDSPSGVKFHMDCCKRHGVKAFSQERLPSLKACMAACATAPACQSVDWHGETGMCYFGKHSGEPTISVSGWSSAHSLGCAGACKKSCGCAGGQDDSKDEL